MNKLFLYAVTLLVCAGCSTTGGFYKSGDPKNGQFSLEKTILLAIGAAAAVAVGRSAGGGGGGGGGWSGYAWDYQPADGQWVCRNKSNGEYSFKENCAGLLMVDSTWPH